MTFLDLQTLACLEACAKRFYKISIAPEGYSAWKIFLSPADLEIVDREENRTFARQLVLHNKKKRRLELERRDQSIFLIRTFGHIPTSIPIKWADEGFPELPWKKQKTSETSLSSIHLVSLMRVMSN